MRRERVRERELSRPPFSLLSLRAQMFMVCINYWGLENVPHSGTSSGAVQEPRLITLSRDSFTVNPSKCTSKRRQLGNRTIAILQRHSIMTTSDHLHTLIKRMIRPPSFSISHSLSSASRSLVPSCLVVSRLLKNVCVKDVSLRRISTVLHFTFKVDLVSVLCSSLLTLSLHFGLPPTLSRSISLLASLCVGRYTLSSTEVFALLRFQHMVSNRPTWVR